MDSLSVVFYRFMNLGHPKSPVRATLEAALTAAGGRAVRSFQTNGTVLFAADDPEGVVAAAGRQLEAEAGYTEVAMVRSLDSLVEVLDGKPFQGHVDGRTYRETFTFFDGGRPVEHSLPWTNKKGDVDLVALYEGLALCVVRGDASRSGNPNAEIERLTGVPATTRTSGTIERLVKAAGRG
ncbi:DUF1697 domain-containing protein [Streptomyces candidus]|uniref:Uncharacterized protein (DUF1697 family) n=1 Tax=Streptomyces candidus TaxID=67283 RepID=A0A7X0HJU7_9ACTN|nr:DUF1697 domain-containing protein [Streptomyces candidus]MBB6438999.1 uncharacterized protein (DUF1697 family) [Streptomyces candidus]GHH44560.1 hypothetical protein GCM10018773_32370 [Streptomyces candidus]